MKKTLFVLFIYSLAMQVSAAETEVNSEQVRAFIAKTGTILYAPVDLDIQEKRTVILSGLKNDKNDCIIQNKESVASPNEIPAGHSLITIELAHNPDSCESLVYKGTVPSNIRIAPPKGIDRTQTQDSIPEKSDDSVGTQEYKPDTRLINGEFGKVPLSYSTSNATQTATAHAVWTDGNHPIMQSLNYEIEVNSVKDEITYSNGFCSGGTITVANEYYWFSPSGWSLDQSSAWYYGHNCNASPGFAFVGARAKYNNAIFPGCSPGVHTNYEPNEVKIGNLGGVTWDQNIYRSGVMQGCGEYLRLYFLNSYQ